VALGQRSGRGAQAQLRPLGALALACGLGLLVLGAVQPCQARVQLGERRRMVEGGEQRRPASATSRSASRARAPARSCSRAPSSQERTASATALALAGRARAGGPRRGVARHRMLRDAHEIVRERRVRSAPTDRAQSR
jgi:hypothetical protein